MALIKAITVLADHKGMTTPRVSGDEYFVDAVIDITQVVAAGSVIPASDFVECSATGAYESATSVAFMHTTMSSGTTLSNDANGGSVRVRVYGNI